MQVSSMEISSFADVGLKKSWLHLFGFDEIISAISSELAFRTKAYSHRHWAVAGVIFSSWNSHHPEARPERGDMCKLGQQETMISGDYHSFQIYHSRMHILWRLGYACDISAALLQCCVLDQGCHELFRRHHRKRVSIQHNYPGQLSLSTYTCMKIRISKCVCTQLHIFLHTRAHTHIVSVVIQRINKQHV